VPRLIGAVVTVVVFLGAASAVGAQGADTASRLIDTPGFGFVQSRDTPLALDAIQRTFVLPAEAGHDPAATLAVTLIPIAPPVTADSLFRLVTGNMPGFVTTPAPDFGRAAWLAPEGVAIDQASGTRLVAVNDDWLVSIALDMAVEVSFDAVIVTRVVMQLQLDRVGGATASSSGSVTGDPSPPVDAALAALLPRGPDDWTVIATTAAGEEPIGDVPVNSKVIAFLNSRSTGVVRGWRAPGATVVMSLSKYPFQLFAAAMLGASTDGTGVSPQPNPRMASVADAFTYHGTGDRSGEVGATFRRGPYLVMILASSVSGASPAIVDERVADISRQAGALLPDGATAPYRFPGTPATALGIALSCLLVTGATLGTRGIGRARAHSLVTRPSTVTFPVEQIGVIRLDDDARGLRRRGASVLWAQLVALNIGVVAVAGDFGWRGVGVGFAALVAGIGLTTWWRRYERRELGPGNAAPWIRPRPIGIAGTALAVGVLGLGIAFVIKGLRYLVLRPTLAQLRWADFFGVAPRSVGLIFLPAGVVLAVAGASLSRAARALARAGTRAVMQTDRRAPMLYLRSFEDDAVALPSIVSARRPFIELFSVRGADPFEESLAWELATYGPVVAVAKPGGSIASLGAAREFLSDATWRTEVAERMANAAAITVAIGATDGLRWEVGQIIDAGHLAKTVFVFPPVDSTALTARWANITAAAEGLGVQLPELDTGIDRVHTVQMESAATPVITIAERRDEASYRTAVDRAVQHIRAVTA
jgi:hypothetical protein